MDEKASGVPIFQFRAKLQALKDHAGARPQLGYPKSNEEIAAYIDQRVQKPRQRDFKSVYLSKADGDSPDQRNLAEHELRILLKAFGILWPCRHFFDPEGHKRDRDVEQFRTWLSEKDIPIRLFPVDVLRPNQPHFADRNVFVFRLIDQSLQGEKSYEGLVRATLTPQPIVGDCENFAGEVVGYTGFNSITLSVTFDSEHSIRRAVRDVIVRDQQTGRFRVVDMSADDQFRWVVASEEGAEGDEVPFLKGALDVAKLIVGKMELEDSLTIEATSELPYVDLCIPAGVLALSALEEAALRRKYLRVAQAALSDRLARARGGDNTSGARLSLGQMTYRRELPDVDDSGGA